jgi:hypothetical protein
MSKAGDVLGTPFHSTAVTILRQNTLQKRDQILKAKHHKVDARETVIFVYHVDTHVHRSAILLIESI